ncbi:MAG: AraC family transcriptional regulator [Planctomycetota bacterium]
MKLILPQDFKYGTFFRTLGPADSEELLGGGFMYKPRKGPDHTDFDPGHYSLCYVLKGSGKYIDYQGRTHLLKPGSFFHRIPGFIHTSIIDNADEWHESFISLGISLSDSLLKMGLVNTDKPCGFAGLSQNLVGVFADIRRSLEKVSEDRLGEILPAMLNLHQQITSTESNVENKEDKAIVNLACQILSKNLSHKIDLKEMCKKQGWGYEKFRKLFKNSIGISPAQYRIRRRIDEARKLLLQDRDTTLSQISDTSMNLRLNLKRQPGFLREDFGRGNNHGRHGRTQKNN